MGKKKMAQTYYNIVVKKKPHDKYEEMFHDSNGLNVGLRAKK